MDSRPLSLSELSRVGRLVRAIHDASAAYGPDSDSTWITHIPAPRADLICHNDLAPVESPHRRPMGIHRLRRGRTEHAPMGPRLRRTGIHAKRRIGEPI